MNKKVWLVDDEDDVAFSVEFTLKDEGYEFLHVDSGEKCVKLMKSGEYVPDLVLLDIMMPLMSGWVVFDKIKEDPVWKTVPVVFLTARVDYTAKHAGDFLGDDYIEKPYDPNDLKKRIRKLIEKN